MSQCKRWEKLICIGVPGWGRNQPTCKAESWRFTSRKLDSHTFGQRHYYYFADMSQHWGMSDPHFWGFGLTETCAEGWRFKTKKLDSHTFAIDILVTYHNTEGCQAFIIWGSSCQGKGSLLFEVVRLGGLTPNLKNWLLHFCGQKHSWAKGKGSLL